MNYYPLILCLLAILCSCNRQNEDEVMHFTVTNHSDLSYEDAPVIISFGQANEMFPEISHNHFPLITDAKGRIIPSQIDDLDFDGVWDELVFVYSLPPRGSAEFTISLTSRDSMPEFGKRANLNFGVRESESGSVEPKKEVTLPADGMLGLSYNPYQTDGPAWENDKVGYRHYFDGRNARDIFGKTTETMVLDTVGISQEGAAVDNYHVLEPWGRDILAVSQSLGAGGLAMLQHGRLHRLGVWSDTPINEAVNNVDTTTYRMINDGPVRAIFELRFNNWLVGEKLYDIRQVVSIWAGRHHYENFIELSPREDNDTLIVGMVNSNNSQPLMTLDEHPDLIALVTHDKQTYECEYHLGMALILPKANYAGYNETTAEDGEIKSSYNAQLILDEYSGGFRFYFLSAWGFANPDFRDRDYFKNFVQTEIKKISQPPAVKLNK